MSSNTLNLTVHLCPNKVQHAHLLEMGNDTILLRQMPVTTLLIYQILLQCLFDCCWFSRRKKLAYKVFSGITVKHKTDHLNLIEHFKHIKQTWVATIKNMNIPKQKNVQQDYYFSAASLHILVLLLAKCCAISVMLWKIKPQFLANSVPSAVFDFLWYSCWLPLVKVWRPWFAKHAQQSESKWFKWGCWFWFPSLLSSRQTKLFCWIL